MIHLSEFDYHLPESHIATTPAEPRDAARLLVVDGNQRRHLRMHNLPELLNPGDVLVFNNSRVIPARIHAATPTGATVEILLHQMLPGPLARWRAFAKPGKRLKIAMPLTLPGGLTASVDGKEPDGQVQLTFNLPSAAFTAWLHQHGQMPLPPYIEKLRPADDSDKSRYQTIYARHDGSVAAPTAGLHFTPELMAALQQKGVECHEVTLHVGAGTFQPVKVEDIRQHEMHEELIHITPETAAALTTAKSQGRRIIAVGTTALRTLESAADDDGTIHPVHAPTRIFITPGYRFKAVDMLLTNFHLPKSTLLMLVYAFAGVGPMRAAYHEAIEQGYRFYSYGDTSLLYRAPC